MHTCYTLIQHTIETGAKQAISKFTDETKAKNLLNACITYDKHNKVTGRRYSIDERTLEAGDKVLVNNKYFSCIEGMIVNFENDLYHIIVVGKEDEYTGFALFCTVEEIVFIYSKEAKNESEE